jgi:hypothetical protein
MSVEVGKLHERPAFIFDVSLAFVFCSVPPAARAADAEAVTIDTTFIVKTPPVRLDRPGRKARASVVLMTGGDGLLNLDATGTITSSTGNFLIMAVQPGATALASSSRGSRTDVSGASSAVRSPASSAENRRRT